ncbi:solute carrier family 27 (fatty acid transporter), member 1, isoform CRA_c [Rattus norvegicus]|uniref:Solute carrier family 27 (Fatty acid transporter), member 1, isoform CRA_c n=1 Tax=Rattus norvegicus TaxID=10116 RepID=A6K9W4_RAT|nr:solute carrier family 27 (fatty acid transporter), member 1, isoform CRA_c [Rattus norvegicus]
MRESMPASAQATSHSEPGEWDGPGLVRPGSRTPLFRCFSCLATWPAAPVGAGNWNLSGRVSLSYNPLCTHLASALVFFSISFLRAQQEPHRHIGCCVLQWDRCLGVHAAGCDPHWCPPPFPIVP